MILRARYFFCLLLVAAQAQAQTPDSSLTHFRRGEALLSQHNFQAAALEFSQAAKGDMQPAWLLVWSHINLGRALDATGQRDRAVKEYQIALDTNDDTFSALSLANMYLSKAFSVDAVIPLPDSGTPPTVLSRVAPGYSAEALLARLEGTVHVVASIGPDGSVTDLRITKTLGLGLDEAALDAVRRWTFAPGIERNEPVASVTSIDVEFHLPARLPGWHVKKIEFAKPDAMNRPILKRVGPFDPAKMNAELAEEASIDAAMSRIPDATITMEIDTLGTPGKFQANAASLPIWGDDAIRALSEWRFSPGQIPVPCVVELAWFPPQ